MLDYVHFQTLIDGLFIKLDPEKILFFDWLSFFYFNFDLPRHVKTIERVRWLNLIYIIEVTWALGSYFFEKQESYSF